MIRPPVALSLLGVLAAALLHTGLVSSIQATPVATSVPAEDPGFEADVLGQVAVQTLPPSPALVTAVRVDLAPGAATQRFTALGPVLMIVEDGVMTMDAELALIGQPLPILVGLNIQPATPAPQPLANHAVREGEQVALSDGSTAELRNASDEQVVVLIVSIAPADASQVTATT